MTHRLVLPLLFLAVPLLAACGGEVPAVEEADGVGEAHAPALEESVVAPPDGVALVFADEGLLERIRISDGEARFIARREVPDGRLVSATLSEEDGRPLYTYEMEVAGDPRVVRVVVDGVSARVTVATTDGGGG